MCATIELAYFVGEEPDAQRAGRHRRQDEHVIRTVTVNLTREQVFTAADPVATLANHIAQTLYRRLNYEGFPLQLRISDYEHR